MKNGNTVFAAAVLFALILGIAAPIVRAQQPARPPEYGEIMAAQRMVDTAARLKEFERIKAVYPQSSMMPYIDTAIRVTKIEMCSPGPDPGPAKTGRRTGERFRKIHFLSGRDLGNLLSSPAGDVRQGRRHQGHPGL